jgi:putative transposase
MKKTRTVPRVIVTDRLRSYGAAHREVTPSVEHRSHKGLNNRAEKSHQPTRQRERAMGFRSVGGAQRFLSAFSGISPHFRPRRHLMPAHDYRAEMTVRFAIWEQITGVASLATRGLSTARNRAPPRHDAPSDTYPPDNVTAPGPALAVRHHPGSTRRSWTGATPVSNRPATTSGSSPCLS